MESKFGSLTKTQKERLEMSAQPLWAALEELGWVDGHGGSEFSRVFPDAIDFIHAEANPSMEQITGASSSG